MTTLHQGAAEGVRASATEQAVGHTIGARLLRILCIHKLEEWLMYSEIVYFDTQNPGKIGEYSNSYSPISELI
jgi:hypothetical protein